MPRKLTPKQLAANIRETELRSAHFRGVIEGRESVTNELKAEKLAQMRAITEMLEQAGRIMSRAGYLLGKANGDAR